MTTTHHLLQFSPPDGPVPAGAVPAANGTSGTRGSAVTADVDSVAHDFVARVELARPAPGSRARLLVHGIATWSTVSINGVPVLESRSMFARHRVDVTALVRAGLNTVELRCHPLTELLDAAPRTPRARWRTRVVADHRLRWVRTALLGRCPGFAPGPPEVGAYRPVVLEIATGPMVESLTLQPRVEGDAGLLTVAVGLTGSLAGGTLVAELTPPDGGAPVAVPISLSAGSGRAVLRVPSAERWWPWTHGRPALYRLQLLLDGAALVLPSDGTLGSELLSRTVGFRTLAASAAAGPVSVGDIERDGIDLHVNGVRVFCRGAVWTPGQLDALQTMVTLGMNMVRVVGLAMYESDAFHQACDEAGLLVWQDLMFAALDVPYDDREFAAQVDAEISDQLGRLAGRPSWVVLCGSSEREQQAAMLGLPPGTGREALFARVAPRLLAATGADAIWVPSAPCGGEQPFHPGAGIATYFGVGGYRRPLADARLAGVRFAAECLAIANVPDSADDGPAPYSARWKAGVARDEGAPWDFDDVRDHYLDELYGPGTSALRLSDPARWLALSKQVSGELMAEVFGEWRRQASPCHGGLILWLRDLAPGAGWGVLDHTGRPKVAARHLARVLAPLAVWTTDEGPSGIDVHLANDGPSPFTGRLRIAAYLGERAVQTVERPVQLAPHDGLRAGVEQWFGRFLDVNHSYRFGPPAVDLVVVTLLDPAGRTVSHAVRFPIGRPGTAGGPATTSHLGLHAIVERCPATADPAGMMGSGWHVRIRTLRTAWGVRVRCEPAGTGALGPDEDAFTLAPGEERVVGLGPDRPHRVEVSSLNARDPAPVDWIP